MKNNLTNDEVLERDFYFLREGDFLPERVGDSKYRHDGHMMLLLRENGTLFRNKEDAIQAGNAIRAYLAGYQLSLESKESHRKHNCLNREKTSQVFRNLLEETLSDKCKHTQSACDGHKDVKIGSPRIVLIKIFP